MAAPPGEAAATAKVQLLLVFDIVLRTLTTQLAFWLPHKHTHTLTHTHTGTHTLAHDKCKYYSKSQRVVVALLCGGRQRQRAERGATVLPPQSLPQSPPSRCRSRRLLAVSLVLVTSILYLLFLVFCFCFQLSVLFVLCFDFEFEFEFGFFVAVAVAATAAAGAGAAAAGLLSASLPSGPVSVALSRVSTGKPPSGLSVFVLALLLF